MLTIKQVLMQEKMLLNGHREVRWTHPQWLLQVGDEGALVAQVDHLEELIAGLLQEHIPFVVEPL